MKQNLVFAPRETFCINQETYSPGTNINKDFWKKPGKLWKGNILAFVPELPMEIPSNTTNKFPEHVDNSITEKKILWITYLLSKTILHHNSLLDPADVWE